MFGAAFWAMFGAAFGANFSLYLNKQQLVALYLKIRFGLPVSVFFFIAFCKPLGGTSWAVIGYSELGGSFCAASDADFTAAFCTSFHSLLGCANWKTDGAAFGTLFDTPLFLFNCFQCSFLFLALDLFWLVLRVVLLLAIYFELLFARNAFGAAFATAAFCWRLCFRFWYLPI